MATDFTSVSTRNRAFVIAFCLILSVLNLSSGGIIPSGTLISSGDGGAVDYPVQDHLTPVDLRIDAAIRAKVEALLLVTGGEYGRMLIIPPELDGESSISIHGNQNEPKKECVITYMVAETNLWNLLSEEGKSGEKSPVRRVDAPLSVVTAEAIRNCWEEMLSRIRPSELNDLRIPTHLRRVEFSIGDATRAGETPIRFGDKVNDLVEIGTSLIAYCQAQPSARSEMERQIQIRSQSLLSKLREKR